MRKKLSFLYILLGFIAVGLIISGSTCCKISKNTTQNDNQTNEGEGSDPNAPKVLFIGSSYFASNDFIGMFKNLVKAGGKSLNVHKVIKSGFYLSDHTRNSETMTKIYEEKWAYVYLQGGCHYISKPKWHQYILPYIKILYDAIKDNYQETKVVYQMPWAYKDGLEWMAGETDTYEQMQQNIYNETVKYAHEIGLVIAPVGWAWRTVILDPDCNIELYQSDYNHPTAWGSYLAACVFYVTTFQESLENVEYYYLFSIEKAKYMQQVASSTVLDDLETWNIVDSTD